ncbi:MAG: hypothetical protein A2Z99_21625 [Treponema sp. GWB1_62_6]|nr:MAG: hypothetical protein A2001_04185 [Treponema sp. GWC1_61_84]OHE67747.1 MAG: hypothetical protein A2Z99_21625 [Treponema sp. GWB1_62_6]OHE75630.1 MAG: hypothetical protein A2413_11180 [Treponema sp. RIFOXYC1_FULL_61_9]HCM27558.1 hemerythrin [Treponema sp.]
MAFIEWSEQFSVDIASIDEQHRHLVELINKLHGAMMAKESHLVLDEIINELIAYTFVHFNTEEEFFSQFGYPEAENHMTEHRQFIEKVDSFHRDFVAKKIGVSVGILDFLTDWLKSHILNRDKAYGPFLRANMA